jgi:hypothetical protein
MESEKFFILPDCDIKDGLVREFEKLDIPVVEAILFFAAANIFIQ